MDEMDDLDISPRLQSLIATPRATEEWLRATKGLCRLQRWVDANGARVRCLCGRDVALSGRVFVVALAPLPPGQNLAILVI